MNSKVLFLVLSVLLILGFTLAPNSNKQITEEEVISAQSSWGNAIVAIGKAKLEGGDYKSAAETTVDGMYAYGLSNVLFKPTKALEDQFRGTREEALSYFVGGSIEEDKGFALQPWSNVRFENSAIAIDKDSALAMGNYYFTDATSKKEVKVEYTFGYIRGKDGELRINLHHSSLPYPKPSSQITVEEVSAAQKQWGEAIVTIGKDKNFAESVVNNMYAYDISNVLFKPTKALEDQFRGTKEEALSYFIGGSIKEDGGFALQPWSNVRFENESTTIDKDSATAMGNYYFTDANTGKEVKVEYTFGYIRGEDGKLRINLHHSSLPYTP